MDRVFYLLFLVCLAAVLVKSESTIEVDENGDEYEVKRFSIQGRQLNEGRSLCVESRRKRATQPKSMYTDNGSNNNAEAKGDATIKAEEQQTMVYYSPTVAIPIADQKSGDVKEEKESDMHITAMNNGKGEEENIKNITEINKNKSTDKEEVNEQHDVDDSGEDVDTIEVIQVSQLPALGQLETDEESLLPVTPSISEYENEADGIVLVQSQWPSKVNQQSHAVYELIPVNYADIGESEEDNEDFEEDEVGANFDFKEELTPVTTTAIWSTGDDSSSDLFNDYDDNAPISVQKVVKKIKKPLKSNKKQNQSSLKSTHKNQYNNRNRYVSKKENKKRRINQKRPNKSSANKNSKLRRGSTTRRKSPQNNKKLIRGQSNNSKKNNKYFNSKRVSAKRNKNKKKPEKIDQGTYTMKQTDVDNTIDQNVNCIIIRKDPLPTAAPSFWNIFGRSVNGAPQASGHFGNRKRANVRFVV